MAKDSKYAHLPEGYVLRRARPKGRPRRVNYGKLPRPAEKATLYWGMGKAGLRYLNRADIVRLVMSHDDFKDTVGRYLDETDRRHLTVGGKAVGRCRVWSAWQLEAVLLFRRIAGKSTMKRAIIELKAHPRELETLGLPAVPSLATISRYKKRNSDPVARELAYLELDRLLRDRVTDLPGFDEEARILGMDGSSHETHYTPPPSAKYEGEFARTITAPDAGYRGGRKAGKGWQLVSMMTEHGIVVAWELRPLNEGEKPIGVAVIESFALHVLPKRGKDTLSVCTCDGGFQSPRIHRALLDARIVPNIPNASHSSNPTSVKSVRKKERSWLPFDHPREKHYSNWLISQLGEIMCVCAKGRTERGFQITKKGKLTVSTKGRCDECGDVTITAGVWRKAQNPDRIAFIPPEDRGAKVVAPRIGNPLHFHDPVSQEYGCDRFGWNESLHSVLQKRFGLLKKGWMKSAQEARTEFAVVFSTISVLLLKRDENLTAIAEGTMPPENMGTLRNLRLQMAPQSNGNGDGSNEHATVASDPTTPSSPPANGALLIEPETPFQSGGLGPKFRRHFSP